MPRLLIPLVSMILLWLCPVAEGASGPASDGADLDPIALVRKIETQYQGTTSHGRTRMTIRTRDWNRVLVLESWSEGREKFLVRILEPAKERGTCTLKVERQIWNYLPKIDRLLKIPSSLMGDKWMGSHFTNDDLVKDTKIDEFYEFTVLEKTPARAVISGIAKPEAAVVWARVLYTIDLQRTVPISIDYFDEEGAKVRTLVFDRVELVQHRWLPLRLRVNPLETPQEFTEMSYESITFDVPIPAGTFSTLNLRKL